MDIVLTLEKIQSWGYDKSKLSSNFHMYNEDTLTLIRSAMYELAVVFWNEFKARNMFDPQNPPELTFACVLTGILGSNLIFMKDNVISSIEINPYGNFG